MAIAIYAAIMEAAREEEIRHLADCAGRRTETVGLANKQGCGST
jgi:hypothetical protein